MRRFAYAVVLTCGLAVCAVAQSREDESFDLSGLPKATSGIAQSQTERELLQLAGSHRSGDAAGAARIQRKLAAYYREKGDYDRARAAEERAIAAGGTVPGARRDTMVPAGVPGGRGVRMPNRRRAHDDAMDDGYGGMPVTGYGGVQTARPAQEKTPSYGAPVPAQEEKVPGGSSLPIYAPETGPGAGEPKPEGGIPIYQPENGAAPAGKAPGALPEVSPAPLIDATPGAPGQPSDFSGRYYVMQGRTMHSWEFRPDGTFQHGWSSARANATDDAHFEAGKFVMAGPYITLVILNDSTGGRARGPRQVRRRIDMRGQGGRDGILLDGLVLMPKVD